MAFKQIPVEDHNPGLAVVKFFANNNDRSPLSIKAYSAASWYNPGGQMTIQRLKTYQFYISM
jgi:hypothetical protein